ncbi:membrane fusion protein, cobalt-zinc-cadmium efflux system [Novimethylophilus kurashikiensis]|uniref:Membrane fusion protein, cobalt-zinc-cadmium efflux system n=1 Tax=Novimethylophilus kurashikiensis TaxID=1825523 RepID=A0A2R5FCX8_9PROT|nr:efflux RND transporter periplasmic adaptor subunit [Novimethylophilus kurashikiensis]GBG15709.1 membrane fusion protein, cobalt-zinc-cadmium efflux system [Novimethylophilus kurashikiensis]
MSISNRFLPLAWITLMALTIAGCGKAEPPQSAGSTQEQTTKKSEQTTPEQPEGEAKPAEGEALKLTDAEIEAAGIKVEEVAEQEVHDHIAVTATIQPNRDRLAHVAPRVAGRIIRVTANLGQQVKQGQTLAQIDSIELGEAHSAYLQAESEARLAQANFARIDNLYSEQIVTQKDYLNARAENEKAKTALRAARDKLRMLGVAPAESSSAVSSFALTAPFSGTIIEKEAVLGELAQPDKSLFTVADLSVVWIEADLFEKDLGKVAPGTEAVVTVSAYPNESFKGRLTYISSTVDKETRTVKARVEVRNPDGRLKPEMFANAAIATSGAIETIVVPPDAVVLMQGIPSVFMRNADGFEPRSVELGERLYAGVVIKSGLKPGELIVVSGAYALKARALKSQIGESD